MSHFGPQSPILQTIYLNGLKPVPRPSRPPESPQAPEGPPVTGYPTRPIVPTRHLDAVPARSKVDLVRYP